MLLIDCTFTSGQKKPRQYRPGWQGAYWLSGNFGIDVNQPAANGPRSIITDARVDAYAKAATATGEAAPPLDECAWPMPDGMASRFLVVDVEGASFKDADVLRLVLEVRRRTEFPILPISWFACFPSIGVAYSDQDLVRILSAPRDASDVSLRRRLLHAIRNRTMIVQTAGCAVVNATLYGDLDFTLERIACEANVLRRLFPCVPLIAWMCGNDLKHGDQPIDVATAARLAKCLVENGFDGACVWGEWTAGEVLCGALEAADAGGRK